MTKMKVFQYNLSLYLEYNCHIDVMAFLTVCSLISCKLAVADKPICCVPTEWEGYAFLDIGEEFQITNAFGSYINGSAHFAYSTNLKKNYQRFKGVQVIDAFPKSCQKFSM